MAASPYLQSILTAFAKMDIEQLQLLLNDGYSYQDTTKEVFLSHILKMFQNHKNSGDTELIYFKGKCSSTECNNCGTGGYCFVGNNSKNYINLLFIQQGDDVTDIFDCGSFTTDEETPELNRNQFIWVNRDDKIDFTKDASYYLKLNNALSAYDEIVTSPQCQFTLDEIDYWLKKHWYTYEKIGGRDIFSGPMKWDEFSVLYKVLNELNNFITTYSSQLLRSTNEISGIDDETSLIDWLLKYEDIYNKIPYELQYGDWGFLDTERNHTTIFDLVPDTPVKVLHQFISFCWDNHPAMVGKYNIYTREEEWEIFNADNSNNDFLSSLKFHLTKREEAHEMGIDIPLNLQAHEEDSSKESEAVSDDESPF